MYVGTGRQIITHNLYTQRGGAPTRRFSFTRSSHRLSTKKNKKYK
jgi:hypothetical protein